MVATQTTLALAFSRHGLRAGPTQAESSSQRETNGPHPKVGVADASPPAAEEPPAAEPLALADVRKRARRAEASASPSEQQPADGKENRSPAAPGPRHAATKNLCSALIGYQLHGRMPEAAKVTAAIPGWGAAALDANRRAARLADAPGPRLHLCCR